MKQMICMLLLIASFFQIECAYTGEALWLLWGNPARIHYDADAHVWINENPALETSLRLEDLQNNERKYTLPQRVPEKREIRMRLNLFWQPENSMTETQMAMVCAIVVPNRRLRLINVEQSINEMRGEDAQFRIWPHLGLLSIGTVADEEGWEVALHDELIQGYVDLSHFVQPGDIVGLSLVVTGIERGVELARQAKQLGASYVIAGNDSAIFRADQLLRLPDHPIDAVFTSNSLVAVRQFLRQVGSVELHELEIPGVAVIPSGVNISNERSVIQAQRAMQQKLRSLSVFDPQDVFVVPKFSLFGEEYWQKVWQNYRHIYGHKHANPGEVRNALALFAQGCTRTGTADVCSYCTIAGVADIRLPTLPYLKRMLETYESFGINYVFNATDSVFEIRRVLSDLKTLGAFFPEGMMLYGRAWGLAHHPDLIDEWLSLTGGRLLVNVGMDAGDEHILVSGVSKASQSGGSRLEENRRAVRNIVSSGAHLHYSLVFGSPGETQETCRRTLEFFEWTRTVLGTQLDLCEADIFWLNFGAPAGRVFHDYGYAQQLAALAGKEISRETWEDRFHRHRDALVVPWECEEAWYDCFTSITVEEAQEYVAQVATTMTQHEAAAPGRKFAFKPG